jgi:hypothetical protein
MSEFTEVSIIRRRQIGRSLDQHSLTKCSYCRKILRDPFNAKYVHCFCDMKCLTEWQWNKPIR